MPRIIDSLRSDTNHVDFGWRIVPFGDHNGDGYEDFLTWDRRSRLYLYHGTPHASFSLPHTSTITLRILNPLGQTVTTLIDSQRLSPGTHSVTWNASDFASDFASDLYLAELTYPSGKLTRKMILVR